MPGSPPCYARVSLMWIFWHSSSLRIYQGMTSESCGSIKPLPWDSQSMVSGSMSCYLWEVWCALVERSSFWLLSFLLFLLFPPSPPLPKSPHSFSTNTSNLEVILNCFLSYIMFPGCTQLFCFDGKGWLMKGLFQPRWFFENRKWRDNKPFILACK